MVDKDLMNDCFINRLDLSEDFVKHIGIGSLQNLAALYYLHELMMLRDHAYPNRKELFEECKARGYVICERNLYNYYNAILLLRDIIEVSKQIELNKNNVS